MSAKIAAPLRRAGCMWSEIKSGLLLLRGRGSLEKFGDRAPMHQVGSDEAGESEWAGHDPVGVVSQAQQQEGDQRDCDLNANGVFGSSQEVTDLQGLFDPSKEQLDGPSTLVQVGDVLRACLDIIGEDAQYLAGLDDDANFTDQIRHWVVAGGGEPFGKVSGPIAEDRRSRRNWPILHDGERRVGLQARDNATAPLIQPRPPTIIVIAEVENVGRSRLD